MKRLVLIDGHGILHRAYHALPPLTTSKGELVNAVFGFASMLLKVIADLQPTHIAVVFDRPEPTFREKIFKDYQAQRPKMDDELASQIDTVKRVLKRMGIEIFEKAGYEADDVLATLVKQACDKFKFKNQNANCKMKKKNSKLGKDLETIIVTGDRDILQLVDSKTKVYMPVKGISSSKLYGEKQVEKKFGIKPWQIVDYKALVGDPSDNYKGVPGIGPKTAASLLEKFNTLEGVYKHLDEIDSQKLRKSLSKNIESAKMAKKLAKIVKDVPIEFDIKECKLGKLDRPEIRWLLENLEFKSLIPRLKGRISNQESAIREKNDKVNSEKKKNISENNQQMSLI